MKQIFTVFTQYRGLSKSVYIIFFSRMLTSMGAFIWPMLTFIMSGKMGLSDMTIGIYSALTGILFLPASLLGGKLADRFPKKKLIITFEIISVCFFVSCAFLEPGYPMLILFIIAGMFANMEGPAFTALFIEASKPAEREKVFSLTYLGMNLGLVFGSAMGGFLYKDHLSLAFMLDGLTTLVATVLIVCLVKTYDTKDLEEHEINEYENEEHESVSTFQVLWQRKSVLIMLFVFAMSSFIYEQWSFSLPLYLQKLFGDGDGARLYGTLVSFNGFIVILFTPILTSAFRKLAELSKILAGITLFSFSYLMILGEPTRPLFFIMIFAFTLGEIVNTIGNSPYVSRRIPSTHRGRVSSYVGVGQMIGGTMGRLVTGFTNDAYGYAFTFTVVGLLGIVCAGVIAMTYRMDKKQFPKLYLCEEE